MKIRTFLPLLLCCLGLSAQPTSSCDYSLDCRVTAPSGMKMRDKPGFQGTVIAYAHKDEKLQACEETAGELTVEGIKGYWRPVRYDGKKGYMFDGFLEITGMQKQKDDTDSLLKKSADLRQQADSVMQDSEEPIAASGKLNDSRPSREKAAPEKPATAHKFLNGATTLQFATETYNYCGEVSKLDPGLLWYAFYSSESESETPRIEPVVMNVMLSKEKMGDALEYDIVTEEEERSLFLLGLDRPLRVEEMSLRDPTEKLRSRGRKIYPGQEFHLDRGAGLKLAATGSVESSGDCPDLKNYRLKLEWEENGITHNQDLMSTLKEPGHCGMPEIYWYGDLTGDGIPEIIFVSVYEDRNVFNLLSSTDDKTQLLKRSAEFIIPECP